MKLSEKMTAKAGRIRGHYLGTTHSSELLLEYAPEVAKLEEKIEALRSHIRSVAQWDAYTAQELDALLADTQEQDDEETN